MAVTMTSGAAYHLFMRTGSKLVKHAVDLCEQLPSGSGGGAFGLPSVALGNMPGLGVVIGPGRAGGTHSIVESIAWNRANPFEQTTGTVLLGTRTGGQLWTARFDSQGIVGPKKVLTISGAQPVDGAAPMTFSPNQVGPIVGLQVVFAEAEQAVERQLALAKNKKKKKRHQGGRSAGDGESEDGKAKGGEDADEGDLAADDDEGVGVAGHSGHSTQPSVVVMAATADRLFLFRGRGSSLEEILGAYNNSNGASSQRAGADVSGLDIHSEGGLSSAGGGGGGLLLPLLVIGVPLGMSQLSGASPAPLHASLAPDVGGSLTILRSRKELWQSFVWTHRKGITYGQIDEVDSDVTLTTWVPVEALQPEHSASAAAPATAAQSGGGLKSTSGSAGASSTADLASTGKAAAAASPQAAHAVRLHASESNGFFSVIATDDRLSVVVHNPALPWTTVAQPPAQSGSSPALANESFVSAAASLGGDSLDGGFGSGSGGVSGKSGFQSVAFGTPFSPIASKDIHARSLLEIPIAGSVTLKEALKKGACVGGVCDTKKNKLYLVLATQIYEITQTVSRSQLYPMIADRAAALSTYALRRSLSAAQDGAVGGGLFASSQGNGVGGGGVVGMPSPAALDGSPSGHVLSELDIQKNLWHRINRLLWAAERVAGKNARLKDCWDRTRVDILLQWGRHLEAASIMSFSHAFGVEESILKLLAMARGGAGGGSGVARAGILTVASAPSPSRAASARNQSPEPAQSNNDQHQQHGTSSALTLSALLSQDVPIEFRLLQPLILYVRGKLAHLRGTRMHLDDNSAQMTILAYWNVLLLLHACRKDAPVPIASPTKRTGEGEKAVKATMAGGKDGAMADLVARKRSLSLAKQPAVPGTGDSGAASYSTARRESQRHNDVAVLITSDELTTLRDRAEQDAQDDIAPTPESVFEEVTRSSPVALLAKHLVNHAADLDMNYLRQRIVAMSEPATLVLVSTIGGAFQDVMRLLVGHRQYIKATEVLSAYCRDPAYASLWYEHSTALMSHAPVAFVRKALIPCHHEVGLNAIHLLPAIVAYTPACNERPDYSWATSPDGSPLRPLPPSSSSTSDAKHHNNNNAGNRPSSMSLMMAPITDNVAVEYLSFLIHKCDNTDEVIHHLYIQKLVGEDDADGDLMTFFESSKWYDPAIAFRICVSARRFRPCVDLLMKLGMPTDAVKLALALDDVALAKDRIKRIKINGSGLQSASGLGPASGAEVERLKEELWKLTGQYVLTREGGSKNALLLLNESQEITVADLLPRFDDRIMLCEFKTELLAGVAAFSRQMTRTRENIEQRQKIIADVRTNIAAVDQAKLTMSVAKRCAVCLNPVLSKNFITFPRCGHAVHVTCQSKLKHEVGASSGSMDHQHRRGRSASASAIESSGGGLATSNIATVATTCLLCSPESIPALVNAPLTVTGSLGGVSLDI